MSVCVTKAQKALLVDANVTLHRNKCQKSSHIYPTKHRPRPKSRDILEIFSRVLVGQTLRNGPLEIMFKYYRYLLTN